MPQKTLKMKKEHNIYCECVKCKKIKNLLKQCEKDGQIHLIGNKEYLKEIRK